MLISGCTGYVAVKTAATPVSPLIQSQPANQAVTAGQTASFSVAATGTAPLSYQWQKNGRVITGATSSSYTTPPTSTSDSGAQFTVLVGNSAGSVTSKVATLTVNPSPLPKLTATPSTASFANVVVGSSSKQTITLSNIGTGSVTITQANVTGADFSITGLSLPATISASTNTAFTLIFAPTSAGSATGSLSVVSNAANSPTTIALSGVGTTSASQTIKVTDYGATGNGTTDDTAAINNAIAALTPGATLSFPCGTYLTTAQLSLTTPNVTVDGGGCAAIHGAAAGGNILVIGNGAFLGSYGPAVALSASVNELSKSFTTVSNLGVSAGDYVYLSQGGIDYSTDTAPGHPTNCDVAGCRGELLKVASVSGNTITVTTALHDAYNPVINAAAAQKLLSPLAGMAVQNITLDGNSVENYGLLLLGVVDSTVTAVTSKNVVYSALYGNSDFNVAWSNVTVTGAGNSDGASMNLSVQGNLSVNGVSISNLAVHAFGFEISGVANGSFSNITVDAAGATGRPIKMLASRYNTFNSLTSRNGAADYNGISLEYYSSHNTYNNCVVTNNGPGTGTNTGNAGINLFGNFNQYNTFNNCAVSGNGNIQFYVSAFDALGLAQDSHNTISGGTFTGSNNTEPTILIQADGTLITGATINGPGAQGIYLDTQATNACVNNNTFMGNSSLGSAISANGSGDLGLGNLFNLLVSNLPSGTCSPPLP
jgi:hypothetical protein